MITLWRICKRLIIVAGVVTMLPILLLAGFLTLRYILTGRSPIEVLDYITEDWMDR